MSRDDSGSFLPQYQELEIIKKNVFLRHKPLIRLPLNLVVHFIGHRQACHDKNIRSGSLSRLL